MLGGGGGRVKGEAACGFRSGSGVAYGFEPALEFWASVSRVRVTCVCTNVRLPTKLTAFREGSPR